MTEFRTVREVCDALGGVQSVAELTDAQISAVHNWRVANRFPAKTYLVIKDALGSRARRAPPSLWGMINGQKGRRS